MVNISVTNLDNITFDNQLIVIGLSEDNIYSEKLRHAVKLKWVFEYLDKLEKNNLDGVRKYGKSLLLGLFINDSPVNVLLIGTGDKNKITSDRIRHLAGVVSLKAKELGFYNIAIPEFLSDSEYLEPLVEGLILSLYEFNKFKDGGHNKGSLSSYSDKCSVILGLSRPDLGNFQDLVNKIKAICDGVIYCRELANSPPNIINPDTLAKSALALQSEGNLHVETMDLEELRKLGLNGIVSVGKGSENEPRLIMVEYNNASKDEKPVLLVGKAVTFDTGGISIKPSDRMDEMKFDKSGGCTVLGIMHALSHLNLPVNVVAVIPSVENMPSGSSYRPGDIIQMHSGKTVEVLNTDAEGRLILADALSYGISRYSPKLVIDFATLTGACIIALGTNVAGLIGNDEKLIQKLLSMSEITGEKIWQLPLYEEFLDLIKSNVATIKNIGGRTGGTITAAAFLSHFVDNTPWAHLDIAGTAWTQDGTADRSYNPKGSTGFGVRLVLKFLEHNINSK